MASVADFWRSREQHITLETARSLVSIDSARSLRAVATFAILAATPLAVFLDMPVVGVMKPIRVVVTVTLELSSDGRSVKSSTRVSLKVDVAI